MAKCKKLLTVGFKNETELNKWKRSTAPFQGGEVLKTFVRYWNSLRTKEQIEFMEANNGKR